MDSGGNFSQSLWTMINGKQHSHISQQSLSRAYIARSFVSLNMLLSRLKSESVSRLPICISVKYFFVNNCERTFILKKNFQIYFESPAIRPGINLNNDFLQAKNAAWGPPYPRGTPKRWLDPTATSTSNSEGGLMTHKANKSVAQATND